jgi:DNA-binding LytR/AlgR family response regulator
MKKINILIVEDNALEAAAIKLGLVNCGFHVCGIASELNEAYSMFEQLQPDISIVDIYMHGKKDGISYAMNLSSRLGSKHPFIFLSNAMDRATFENAKLTHPFNYLLKPFNQLELRYAIELAINNSVTKESYPVPQAENISPPGQDVFFVKKGNVLIKIVVDDINYIEVDGKYCKLTRGKEKFIIQQSLRQLFYSLPSRQFIRIHRNYIANVRNIQKINLHDHAVIMQDGQLLSYSRRYIDDLMHNFSILK